MEAFIYVVFTTALLTCCYSQEVRVGHRLNRNTNDSLQKIFEILKAQDEKINRLHTLAVMNQFLPKCTTALKSEDLVAGTNCWIDMITQIKTVEESVTTELRVLSQLVTDSYEGQKTRLLLIVKFIKNNFRKGSELANGAYVALLDAMDSFGQLYLKNIPPSNGIGSGFVDFTYRTLIEIRDAEGDESIIFTQTLPTVVLSILSGKTVYIRNNVTRDFMYAPPKNYSGSNDTVTKILVDNQHLKNPRYIWKLRPVETRWSGGFDQESFYIENTFDNKILAVADGDGSLTLAEATEGQYKSTWSMFYIRLVQGNTGQEVAIQCSYWGIKTLALDEKEAWKMPKLRHSKTLDEIPTSVWLLEPEI